MPIHKKTTKKLKEIKSKVRKALQKPMTKDPLRVIPRREKRSNMPIIERRSPGLSREQRKLKKLEMLKKRGEIKSALFHKRMKALDDEIRKGRKKLKKPSAKDVALAGVGGVAGGVAGAGAGAARRAVSKLKKEYKQYRTTKTPSKKSLEAQKTAIHRTTMGRLRKYRIEKTKLMRAISFGRMASGIEEVGSKEISASRIADAKKKAAAAIKKKKVLDKKIKSLLKFAGVKRIKTY